jgi:hypothetical protein
MKILEELFGEIEDERRVVKRQQVRGRASAHYTGQHEDREFNDTFLFTVLRFGGLENLGETSRSPYCPRLRTTRPSRIYFRYVREVPDEGDSVSYGSLHFVNRYPAKELPR